MSFLSVDISIYQENEFGVQFLIVNSIVSPLSREFQSVDRIGNRTRSSWLNCALRDDEAAYWVSVGHYEAAADVIDDPVSVEGIYAFLYCTKSRSGQVSRMPDSLIH